MKTRQEIFQEGAWSALPDQASIDGSKVQLVLLFGSPAMIAKPEVLDHHRRQYPSADIVLSSTSGEILDSRVYDDTVVATAIALEKTTVKATVVNLSDTTGSFNTGERLLQSLKADDLRLVFVISDGLSVNGSELVAGINSVNERQVIVTGGLAGDGADFRQTLTGLNSKPVAGQVIGIGFYGSHLKTGNGTVGGWDEFGHERVITKSDKNILYEIDGKNALELYKTYLGDYINELPGSALLFPLSLKKDNTAVPVVRTILSINEENSSMVFAGNMPEGSRVRFMKASFSNLISGSSQAAADSVGGTNENHSGLAILISCIGRKLILNQRTEEEIEAARAVFGKNVAMTGFYSYGEICPFKSEAYCELHNQTMTITTISED